MKAERWQQIDKLLERVLELEPGERRDFLDEACAGDEELFREVEALLEAHEQAGSLLSSPAFGIANQKSADSLQSLTGETLGHYQILSRLGEGGMGVVYKARDTHLDRFVAIKVLPPELVADPDRKRRFAQEAKAASALNHPNIITIHDIASENGTDFMVMEYVEGKTLGQLIPRRGLKLNEVLKYAIQIADALAKAHGARIVHRDLKPGNIMVGDGGLVKVLDFGLAKLTERPPVGEDEATRTTLLWTVADENGFGLCISRQKHRLVYSREVSDVNIWRLEMSGRQVKPAYPERFIFSTRDETNPQISPDGKKVAFSSNRSGTADIWICSHDGSNPIQLTSSSRGDSGSPRWSPDSRWVSFDSNIDGQWEVYVVDANGGKPRRLTSHPASDIVPSWSRDGKSLYFGSNRSGSYQVWKMPASGGEPSQITQKGGLLPLESPDGNFVYYTKGYSDRRIWKVPRQGGEEAQVLGPIFRRNYDVAKDGIYFVAEPDSSKSHSICFFSFATGRIKTIASIENAWGNYISVSPDSHWILYPKLESEGSDLMLVENFR